MNTHSMLFNDDDYDDKARETGVVFNDTSPVRRILYCTLFQMSTSSLLVIKLFKTASTFNDYSSLTEENFRKCSNSSEKVS